MALECSSYFSQKKKMSIMYAHHLKGLIWNLKLISPLKISQTLFFMSKPEQTYTNFQNKTKFKDTKSLIYNSTHNLLNIVQPYA